MPDTHKTLWMRPRLLITGGTILFFLALSVILSLRYAPSVIGQGRDSGIFAYTGKMIREGGLPYRDSWDNKPPGVYYIDALAFLLFGTNRWAIWIVDTASVFAASLIMFWLVLRFDRRWFVAYLAGALLILVARSPLLIWDTNFTETYALPWQMACFAFGFQYLRAPRFSTGFLLGLSACMAFMYKQTTVAVALTYIPAILLAHHPLLRPLRRFALGVGSMIAGGLSGVGVIALYLYANGILDDAADATLLSAGTFHEWVSGRSVSYFETLEMTLTHSIAPAILAPALPFLIAAVMIMVRRVSVKQYTSQRAAALAVLSLWAGLTLLLDLGLANITYRAYEHYYTTIAPALILLVITGLALVPGPERWPEWASYVVLGGSSAYLIAVLGTGTIGMGIIRLHGANWDVTRPELKKVVAQYVERLSEPGDTVLVWGATTGINFQSDRNSPSQYTYGYPLIVPEERSEEHIEELLRDLEEKRPALIVDTAVTDGNRIPPLEAERRAAWERRGGRRDVADLSPIYQFFEEHCSRPIQRFTNETIIYQCSY